MHRIQTARLLLAGTALALAATPAFAQDDEPPQDSFTGFYVAASGGAAIQNNDNDDIVVFDVVPDGEFGDVVTTTTGANAFSPGFCGGAAAGEPGPTQISRGPNNGGPGCENDDDDEEYAIKVGYDQQFGNWVAGVLLEGSMTDASDSTTAFSTTPASYTFTRSLDYAIAARGRFGWTPGGGGMFYVTGGPSYAELDHDFNTTNTVNSFTQRGGDSVWGYQFGGGAEFGLASGLGVALEYLYSKYDDEDYFVEIRQGTAGVTNPFIRQNIAAGTDFRPSEQDFDYHSIRMNLLYRFR